jgi:hypothetical protein
MADARPNRTLVAIFILGALVLGCGSTTAPSSSAGPSQVSSAAPSQASQPSSAAGIELQRTGPIGCDAIGVDYKSATIKIDAAADPDVWAQTDAGKSIAVKWTAGFTATNANPPVIQGPKADEVARDGTVITVPADASPRLAGYFVCLGPDTIYVLETDPQ